MSTERAADPGQRVAVGNAHVEGECARRVGHGGAHDEAPQPTTAQRAAEEAVMLADLETRTSGRLGWLAIRLDEAVVVGDIDDEQRASVRELLLHSRSAARTAGALAENLERLDDELSVAHGHSQPASRAERLGHGIGL